MRRVYLYKNFPQTVSKVFILSHFLVGGRSTEVYAFDVANPTDYASVNNYTCAINILVPTADFMIGKHIQGSWTTLASEAVDLSTNTYYKVAFLVDGANNVLKAWREQDPIDIASPKLSANDSDITSFNSFALACTMSNTSTTETYKFKVPLIVVWKY